MTTQGRCDCGAVAWSFAETPEAGVTCNCTLCARYGVIWAYDYENERIHVSGPTSVYLRGSRQVEFHFCPQCACVCYWRGHQTEPDGRRRMAVNLRMADPESVRNLPLLRFDGLEAFERLPADGSTIADIWF